MQFRKNDYDQVLEEMIQEIEDKQIEQTVTLLSISNCCYLHIYIWYLYSTLFFITFIFKYYDTV